VHIDLFSSDDLIIGHPALMDWLEKFFSNQKQLDLVKTDSKIKNKDERCCL